MYWNNLSERYPRNQYKINRNMRCIEMYSIGEIGHNPYEINRNMRCIEMEHPRTCEIICLTINRNMRCIEIKIYECVPEDLQD